MTWRCRCVIAFALLAAAEAAGWGEGDLAVIRSARPGTAVRVVSRQAIIGWNGTEEVMILATTFSADGEATVLQAFPLPDLPLQTGAARCESLWVVEQMVAGRDPSRATGGGGGAPFRPGDPLPVQIAQYDLVPVRDRAVIAVKDADGFLAEATAFATRQGGRLSAADGAALWAMAARYLGTRYHDFALEAVDLKRGVHMVGPTSYRFRSDRLFFPSPPPVPGAPPRGLQFFLLTPLEPQQQALSLWLKLLSSAEESLIRFPVNRDDARRISGAMAGLFSESDEVVLTAVAPEPTPDPGPGSQPQPPSPRPAAVSQGPLGGTSSGPDGLAVVRETRLRPRAAVVTGLAWSPAGDRLCVVESRRGGDRERTEAAVVLDLARGSRQELAVPGWLSPRGWSPDGKEISFLDDTGNIQVVEVDHDRVRHVTGFDASLSARGSDIPPDWSPPVWSATGRWLAFGALADLWVVRPDGRDLRRVTQRGRFEAPSAGGLGSAEGSGRRPVTQPGPAAAVSSRDGGLEMAGGGRGGPMPLPLSYAWSPGGNVLAYGQPDAKEDNWSVQGYEPETGRPAPVRGDLRLKGVRALSWQPGGGQLAVVGIGRMAKQTIYLIPQQGPIRALPTDLTSVEAMWTGDGRTLLIRGGASGTERLTVRAVAADGAVRTLPPTHFLADQDVTILAARPGTDEIAFALGTGVYLAHADGSGWRRLQRAGRVAVRPMANPLERWQRDPVVLKAARRWRQAVPYGSAWSEAPDELIYGIWNDFLARWKAQPKTGASVLYRDLPQDLQREVLTGLVYQTFRRTSVGADPAAVTVPGWYWWLDEARIGLSAPDPQTLYLTVAGPDGARHLFAISRPRGSPPARRALPWHLWWPTAFGTAAVVVALVGWRQRKHERERPPEASGPRASSGP